MELNLSKVLCNCKVLTLLHCKERAPSWNTSSALFDTREKQPVAVLRHQVSSLPAPQKNVEQALAPVARHFW